MQKTEGLKKAAESLLKEQLPKAEADSLRKEGFLLKKPNRETALLIALYKKAKNGDLSAFKEIRSIVSGENADAKKKAVIIVDDIKA